MFFRHRIWNNFQIVRISPITLCEAGRSIFGPKWSTADKPALEGYPPDWLLNKLTAPRSSHYHCNDTNSGHWDKLIYIAHHDQMNIANPEGSVDAR